MVNDQMREIIAAARQAGAMDQPHRCEFCGKGFMRERTLASHQCEPKRRVHQRSSVGSRLGYMAYCRFYQTLPGQQNTKTAAEFESSSYYLAFVKFGWHLHNINAIASQQFVDWLLLNNKKLDHWCQDSLYQEFLNYYIAVEPTKDALERSILHMDSWAQENKSLVNHYFRYANANRICFDLSNARISPWVVYCCDSGVAMLARLNQDQILLIYSWIDPDRWSKILSKNPESEQWCRSILTDSGF